MVRYDGRKMIVGIGVDLVEIGRITKAYERWGRRFLKRVYADVEIEKMPSSTVRRWEYLASRFSAKEAFLKALGTGIAHGLGLKDVWVVNEPSGRPRLSYSEDVGNILEAQGIKVAHISISHEKTMAISIVVLES
ncbi:Holo-[acyl-carrier protein] synthase [Dissulfuribacter thermophilus]|uniref:Holo-[acyl-carrier-protein] synthase n=1 Tax=Dissulfuribacter thermophilus TaxID=1156395 RepID=A0A1B9F5C6_9BACT|nr:holo-ACP synthase [Dissulfuribacter thermophilus]OCC15015.1 Holo-[acyl-carrier protein] synthase [Dissulfuribacter thermophilus]